MRKALLPTLSLVLPLLLQAQTGTDFWVAPPDVTLRHNMPGDEPIYLNVTTGTAPATITVSQPANPAFNGGSPIVLNLPASSATRYDMTALKSQLETRPTNTICNTGLHIQSTADITCYYESSNTNNPDILALKGVNGLGTEFYIPLHKHAPFHNHDFNPYVNDLAFASFDIVATQNNSTVMIYSPVAVDGHSALTPFVITLNAGQTYSCANTDPVTHTDPLTHPSGAVVLSDKPVAVSIKDDSNHNPSGGCYDLMLDQIVPVDILGTDYVAVKGALNNNGDESVFVMAVENNTKVYINGSTTAVATLFAGQYYRHDMDYLNGSPDNATLITGSKPLYAVHVTGFGCEQGMALLPPLNCAGSSQLSFTRSTSEAFYLNLLVRNGSQNDFVVTGPGTATIPGSAFQVVPGTGGEWLAARIQYNTTEVPVNQAFIVSNTSDVFSLGIINGGATSGCRYGFFSEFAGKIVVDAGPDQNVCATDVVDLSGSVSGGSTTGVWTATGSGTFQPNDTDLEATYVPSVGDIALGSVTITLTSTGNCTPESDEMTVNFQALPIVDAGSALQVCSNNPSAGLSGSVLNAVGGVWTGGSGTFLPANSNLGATYTPTATEIAGGSMMLHLTSTGNGVCPAVEDSVQLSFGPSPTANAGPDQTRCANNAVATLNGSFTVATGGVWSGGSGTFDPSTTNMAATYTPTAAEIAGGSVTLTLTTTGNGTCNAVSDQVQMTYTAAPLANAGADVSVCANNPTVVLSGSITGATGGVWSGGTGTYSPNNTALNANYTPTAAEIAAGTMTLTLTTTGNGNCNPVSDDKVITFTASPTVDAGANGTVCANAPTIGLSGTISGASGGIWSGGGGTYTPNNTTLNASYTPTAAEIANGSVTLTLTTAGNGNCNAVSDQVTWTITPAPTANAGSDQTLCANNAVATLNGSFTVATGGVWSGGSGTFDPSTTNMAATYTPTAAEIAGGSVTLTLTTTGNGGCVAVSDQVTLTYTASPTVNAGSDVSICANNANITLGGTVSGATGGIWSGGSGSFVPNNTTLNASYTPTAAEIAAGTMTLTLTTTGNGNCNAVSDAMVVTFTPSPTVDAGANGTVCANNANITLSGSISGASGGIWSGGGGTYTPNNTTLNASYTPTAAEIANGSVTLTLTTAGNGNCNAVSDQVTWTITPAPTANAGPDRVLCANNAVAALSGAYTVATGGVWSGGAGTFDPSTTNMSALYTPTAAELAGGTVTLTLTTTGNGLCNAATDQLTITYTDAPSANAGPDVTVCANNAAVTLNGSVVVATGGTWSGGTGTFTPNANTLNATYAPGAADLAAGQVLLTLTTTGNGTCTPATDTRTITYTPAPIVDAGANGTVCANLPMIALNGSVGGAVGGVWSGGAGTFTPNNITLNASYTPTAAEIANGSVTLILTSAGNGNCDPVSDQVTWTITPAPTVNAGVDQVLCGNNANAVLNATVTVATGVQWSGGTGAYAPASTAQNITYSPSPVEIANGSVVLTTTTTGNGICGAVSDQVELSFTPAPIVNAGPDQSVSSNNADTQLAGSFTVASGCVWSGGAGSYSPNNTTASAIYTPTAAEVAAGSVTLTLTTTGNGACSAVSDQMTITFTAAPTANAGPDQTVCANNPTATLSGSVTIASGGIWSGGAGIFTPNNAALNATYMPSAAEIAAGSVTLVLTTVGNGNSNPVSDQMVITISPAPVVNAGVDFTICANQPVAQLAGVVNNAAGGVWSGGSGAFDPSATNLNATYTPTLGEIAGGAIMLTLTSTGNGLCNAVSDQVTISISPAPVVNAGPDQTVCTNNADVQLAGMVSNAGGAIWSGGTGAFSPSINALGAIYTPSATELANGSLTLTLTSTGNGSCAAVSDQLQIFFSQSPVVNAGSDVTVCANDPTVVLNGSVTIAAGGAWSGGSGTFTPNNTDLHATYLPSPAEVALGTVTLTLTSTQNGLCNPVSDAMTISIIASPIANAGNDIAVCANNAQVQLGGSVSGAGGGQWSGGAGTFTPSIASLNASYTPTPAEIAAGTLTLTLTTIGNGNCVPVSDDVLITFTSPPTADAGTNGVYCANNANIALNGAVTVATGGAWSGAQGTFTPNANALNAVYAPSLGELAAGSVTLVLTTTGNNGCTAVTDAVTYVFTPAPTANAGADANSCANNADIALNGAVTVATGGLWSGGAGSFSPGPGDLNATYVPTAAEIANGSVTLLLTTVGNGQCNAVNDAMTLTIGPAPIVDAGQPLSSCANNPSAQLAGTVQSATGGQWSGAGTFTPSTTNLNATYTPTAAEVAAGTAVLTLTSTGNGLCNAENDQVILSITDAPVVEAGPDQVLCANNAMVQLAGQVTNANGGQWTGGAGAYTPSASALNAVYTPSAAEIAAGGLWLRLTSTGNGGCLPSQDSVHVAFTTAPTANAGPDAHVCANDAQVLLAGAITVAGGGIWSGGMGLFTPTNATLNATYGPTPTEIATGTVTLVLTTTGNGNCSAVRDSMNIVIDPVPVVNAGPDQQICANNPTVQLNGFVGNASGGQWSGGSGTFTPGNTALATTYEPTAAEIASGSLTLTLTSTGTTICDPIADQVTITFSGSPVVDAGMDQSICANNSAVQLGGNVTNANGGTWTGGNGTFAPSPNVLSPVYTPTPAEITGGSVNLTLTSTGNGNCLAENDVVSIAFTPAPMVDAGVDMNVCENAPTVTLNGAVTVASGGQWTGGLGTFSPSAQDLGAQYTLTPFELGSGAVTLTLTTTGNGNCLAVADQLTIVVTPAPTVDAGADLTTCSSDLQIPLSGDVQGGSTTGIWTTTGSGTFFPSANMLNATYLASSLDSLNGTVDLTLTSTNNGLCSAESDGMTLTILPNAVANAGADQVICATAATVQLNGTISGNATQGAWTTTGTGTFTPDASTPNAVYQLAPGDAALGSITFTWSVNSCDNAMDQMTVTIVPASSVDAGTDAVTCFDDLDVVINGSINGASNTGVWSTLGSGSFVNPVNALSNVYQASQADSLALGVDLVLTATNTGACSADADTVHIAILPQGNVDAGPDLTYCANNANVQLSGILTGDATQVIWTTSGTGAFYPNAHVLTPTYVPSAVDTAIGSLTLTLSAPNTCNNAMDGMQLDLTPAPYVNAGPDQTYCNQVAQFTLSGSISGITAVGEWTTTGTGTIANPGALNTGYTASAADVAAGHIDFVLTSLNNGNCNPVTDAMTIWLTNGITVNAGPDQSVCVLSDHANLQGSVQNGSPTGTWTTSGSGTFSPDPDVLNAEYYFSPSDVANGSVVLTFTATNTGTCPTTSDQMLLTFGNASFAYAGADLTVCANAPLAHLSGNFSGGAQGCQWSTSGTGSFSNNTDPHATYTLSASDIAQGGVQLTLTTVTNGSCQPSSDVMDLVVQPLPNIFAGADVIVCTAGPLQLTANAVNASSGTWTTSGTGTFLDPNALTTLYFPSAADSVAGSVMLTVTTAGTLPCNSVSDDLLVTFGGGLAADAGSDVVTCSTAPDIDLNGTVAGTTTGTWTTSGTGSFVPSANDLNATYVPGPADFVIGNIHLMLSTTNNQGCPAARDTLSVEYHLPPNLDAGVGVLLCNGLQDVQLNATVQNEGALQWFTAGTGDFSADSIADPIYSPSLNDSISGGVYLILTAYGTGGCGNASDSLLVDIGPTRIANAGADMALCADGGPIQLNGAITGVSGGTWSTTGTGTFLPSPTTLNAVYVPSNTDLVFPQLQFVLATTGNMGCPAGTDTVTATLQQPPTADAGPDVSTCDATAAVQLAGSYNGTGGVQWSTSGNGTFQPNATDPGATYQPGIADEQMQQVHLYLTTTGNQACTAAMDSLLLSFVNPVQPAFAVDNACADSPTLFTDASTTTGSPIIGWTWDFGNGGTGSGPQATNTFPTTGQYAVTLTAFAQNGCSASTTQVIDVLNAPMAGFGISGDLFAELPIVFADSSYGATNWYYDFGDGTGSLEPDPTHIYADGGQFIIIQTVTNAAGCSDSDSLLISIGVKDILPPKLPNAFSPNGDGVNDVFYVRGGPFETIDLKIYNGWGELVFRTEDPEFGWDGTHDGAPELNGVYVYTVVATTTEGLEFSRTGKVTLIR
ncbi:MAG: gliding motility-associated C-terminal domain-containing protein [Flavobacteriales bacterium]|nr:gliding motility-associated C-terminal domain-containing protein [Flavobacteriales bacterium]